MKIVKKTLMGILATFLVLGMFATSAPASDNDSWRIVKRAVQEDQPRPAEARAEIREETRRTEPRWFKIVIKDHNGRSDLKITLPLSLIEGLAELASGEHLKCNGRDLDLDFPEILRALKKAGPMALIEITGDDGLIKVWIE
jgi:hypothetical protein